MDQYVHSITIPVLSPPAVSLMPHLSSRHLEKFRLLFLRHADGRRRLTSLCCRDKYHLP